jgi:hypothetical protein
MEQRRPSERPERATTSKEAGCQTDGWSGSTWASPAPTPSGCSTATARPCAAARHCRPPRASPRWSGPRWPGRRQAPAWRWSWNQPARPGCRSRCCLPNAATRSTGSARPRRTTCAGSRPGTPSPTASTPTPWPGCRWPTPTGCTRWCCRTRPGRRWTAGCAPLTGSPSWPPPTSAAPRTWSASCCQQRRWLGSSARPTWRSSSGSPTPTRWPPPGVGGCSG